MLIGYVSDLIKDKKVCILGFGREGRSTYELFEKAGGYKTLTVCDLNPVSVENAEIVTGADYQKNLDRFDIIMKSPGIVLEDNALSDMTKLYSQTEIFFSVYREQIIGITGTKGKSTTSSLIYHVLKECGKSTVLLGNIGIPCFDGDVKEGDIVVFELSSHQLEYTHISPKIAIFLNIFPEHLDHYGTFDKYFDAKKNIYRYQKKGDILICGSDTVPESTLSSVTVFGEKGAIAIRPHSFVINNEEISLNSSCPLLGSHNVNNIAAAYAVTEKFGIQKEDFLKALSTFRPLPHRLENVGTKDGITYYDDSISTCSQTTIQALQSLPNVGTLLVGGMDRGIDYSPLVEFLTAFHVPHVIFMYDTGKRIMKEFEAKSYSFTPHYAENLKEAVALSKQVTPVGSICLLSPAAASYGFFKNFEDRGDQFKQMALND